MNVQNMFNWSSLIFGAITVVVSLGNYQPARAGSALHWQSDNRTPSELSSELNSLYGGLVELLEQGQRVTTERLDDIGDQQVVQIAKSTGLYLGTHFPSNLNAYLCLLNPDLCKAVRSNSGDVTYKWHNKPGDSILLPVINFEKVVLPKPYQKKKNDTIRSIVVNDRGGCVSLDARCERYLQALNRTRQGFMEPAYEGKILVPTATYRAEVELEQVDPKNTKGFVLPPENASTGGGAWLDQLEQKLLPAARLTPHSIGAQPFVGIGNRAKIRSLVNFPVNLELRENSTVAVFDRQVFIDHCDFHARIKFIPVDDSGSAIIFGREQTVKTGGNGAPAIRCNSPVRGKAKKGRDHGTHVVGIIGARTLGLDNMRNVLRRHVYAFQVPDRQRTAPTEITSSLTRTIAESLPDALPNVMNMSISYDFAPSGRNVFDPIAELIRDLENSDYLFVAAAGNAPEGQPGERFQGTNCTVRPACVDAGNVISVVALDLNHQSPSVLPSSNRGEVFDIAAPGADIESTTFSHTKGVMTGSSQAVPLVSTAASLLMSVRTMLAWQARHRLMYTAALFPQLEQDVFSGRLDIAAALDLENAKITHTSPSLPATLSGQLMTGNHRKIEFLDFDSDEAFLVHPRDIRRLHSHRDEDYALLFYVDGRTGRNLIRRRVFLQGNDGQMQLKIEAPTSLRNKVREVPIASILNYVAAF